MMDDEIQALADQQQELTGLLAGRPDEDWHLPSACAGWSVGDVVLHLIQTNEMAIASAEGRFQELLDSPFYAPDESVTSLDDVVDLAVRRARGASPAELFDEWQNGARHMREALVAAGPSARLPWVVGTLSARTLVSTRIAETWIHTGDVAHRLGVELEPTDRLALIARLAWRTLPHAFGRVGLDPPGPVGFDLVGPHGDEWRFGMELEDGSAPPTVISGTGLDLVRVASQRYRAVDTGLVGTGPDAEQVLELVRSWA
jgi:uncharacterized protein (TIGR03084 family)